ncbi:hypothetical protein CGMCC3_g7640 [Colletotrichum fructicola]|nr:uncharacterized protein CGMCC3_g7640 [Colletotrichum fructicola]KAE9576489.1 hypothetical protein CGMCC3_g7640 [Colletotrichum fructicola]
MGWPGLVGGAASNTITTITTNTINTTTTRQTDTVPPRS